MEPNPTPPPAQQGWRDRARTNLAVRPWYRFGVGLVGALMMLGAALTGWLPGPGGIPLFLAGLAVWSTEFAWAHRLMLAFKRWFDAWLRLPRGWRWAVIAMGLGMAALTWWGLAVWHGLPEWLPHWARRHLERLPLIEG